MAGTFEMEDTTRGSIGSLRSHLPAYASYVDNFGGFPELVRAEGAPGVFLLSITIFGNRAQCADFEKGAMSADQAGGWLDHVAEPNPWLYSFASNMQNVINAAGSRKYVRWSAHTGQGPHICGARGRIYPSNPGCQYPDADITQYVFSPNGRNVDISIGDARLLGPPPPPPDPHGYKRFPNDVYDSPYGKIRERDVVMHYDGARQHPHRYARLLSHDLEPKLHYLADRVRGEALRHRNPDGTPSNGTFDRGWRFQQLIHRAQGARFV